MTTLTTTFSTIGQTLTSLFKLPKQAKPSDLSSSLLSYESERNAIDQEHAVCKSCNNLEECQYSHKGYRRIYNERGILFEECELMADWKAKRKRENQYKSSNLPQQYKGLTLKDAAKYLHRDVSESSYLAERNTESRLMLLSAIGNERINRGEEVEYISALELLMQLRYNNPECEVRMKHYQGVEVLVIDDIGVERKSEFNEEQLYMVIQGRRRKRKATIVGSEAEVGELRYSERLKRVIEALAEQ